MHALMSRTKRAIAISRVVELSSLCSCSRAACSYSPLALHLRLHPSLHCLLPCSRRSTLATKPIIIAASITTMSSTRRVFATHSLFACEFFLGARAASSRPRFTRERLRTCAVGPNQHRCISFRLHRPCHRSPLRWIRRHRRIRSVRSGRHMLYNTTDTRG